MHTGISKDRIFIPCICILKTCIISHRKSWIALLNAFVSLGHYAPATLKDFLKLTHLTEQLKGGNTSLDLIKNLLGDHESIIEFIRSNIKEFDEAHKDAGTSDFVTALMEKHEKTAWMLRAHLK